jgi:hypothetical protein
MNLHSLKRISVLIFLAFWICSCGVASSTREVKLTNEPTSESTYPGVSEDFAVSQPYPMEQEEKSEIFFPENIEIPTPEDDSGIVTGKLLVEGSREAYLGANLVLGEVVDADQPGYPPLVGYSEDSDPKAVLAKNGSFLFVNIPPGKYGIVMTNPLVTNLVEDPKSGETLIIKVEAGKITDLGELFVK